MNTMTSSVESQEPALEEITRGWDKAKLKQLWRRCEAQEAKDLAKEYLCKKYGFLPQKVDERLFPHEVEKEYVYLRDVNLKAGVTVVLKKKRSVHLEDDGRWTRYLFDQYRLERTAEDISNMAAMQATKRLVKVKWYLDHEDQLAAECRKHQSMYSSGMRMVDKEQFIRTMTDEDKEQLMAAAREKDVDAVMLAVLRAALGKVKHQQDEEFRAHPDYPKALELARGAVGAKTLPVRMAMMMLMEEACERMQKSAWGFLTFASNTVYSDAEAELKLP